MPFAIILILVGVVILAWAETSGNMASSVTQRIAEAIAKAEGFFAGSVSQRAKNPGNLKLGTNPLGTIGGKTIFATLEEGWQALYQQIEWMLTGQSRYYSPDMTIREIAQIYTGNDNPDAWANIVAGELGVTPDTSIGSIT